MTLGAFGLITALALTAVFAAAGVAKIVDPDGTRTAVADFGTPKRLVTVVAFIVTGAEIIVGLLLLPASTRAVGAAGALALLGVFSAAIAVSLANGRTPDCHCFGQLHSEPTSWKTLGRNGVLAGLAGFTLAASLAAEQASAFSWVGNASGVRLLAVVLSFMLVALGAISAVAFSSFLRTYGKVLLRLEDVERRLAAAGLDDSKDVRPAPKLGLDPGTRAPAFVARDAAGAPVSLDDLLLPGLPLLLLFSSPSCGPCNDLLPEVAVWQNDLAASITVAIVSGGDDDATTAESQEHGLEHMLVDHDLAIFDAYRAAGTPSAVLIGPDGAIASHVAPGSDWIEQLLLGAVGRASGVNESAEGLPIGSTVPNVSLQGLDSRPISLVSDIGEETVVVFWNPDCGFCESMRDDLLVIDRSAQGTAPRLVIVSSGEDDSTRADGFSCAVALDPDFAVGAAFEANGTPLAVLIDSEGRVASPLTAGAEAILALASGRTGVASVPSRFGGGTS